MTFPFSGMQTPPHVSMGGPHGPGPGVNMPPAGTPSPWSTMMDNYQPPVPHIGMGGPHDPGRGTQPQMPQPPMLPPPAGTPPPWQNGNWQHPQMTPGNSPWGNGQNPMAAFQNMTPEQRQAMIQQFRDRIGQGQGMPGFMQGLFGMGNG